MPLMYLHILNAPQDCSLELQYPVRLPISSTYLHIGAAAYMTLIFLMHTHAHTQIPFYFNLFESPQGNECYW